QPACPVCPEPVKAPEAKPLDDAQLKTMSTSYLEAWAKHDAAAVDGMLASGFMAADGTTLLQRKQYDQRIQKEIDQKHAAWTVTWAFTAGIPGPAGAMFVGDA